jgi:hypothetical protein
MLPAWTDWNSLFRVVGSSCIDLQPEGEIRRRLSEWIRLRLQPSTEKQVELTHARFQGFKIQLYCLGLIDTRMVDRPGRDVAVPVLVWALTELGRATLAHLMAAKKVHKPQAV